MGYVKSIIVPKKVYHYTRRENVESIMKEGKIYPADGLESWYCLTLDDLKQYLELTAMNEGQPYVDSDFQIKKYPKFIPENFVILELKPRYSDHWYYFYTSEYDKKINNSHTENPLDKIKICHKGTMEFKNSIKIIEMTELIKEAN